jgi:hypothetical protein
MKHVERAASELGAEKWHAPWSGSNGGNCVEVKKLEGDRVALRQSTDPDGPALICPSVEFAAFIDGAKSGLADFLLA